MKKWKGIKMNKKWKISYLDMTVVNAYLRFHRNSTKV